MLDAGARAADATGGLVTPAVGGADRGRRLRPRLRLLPPRRRAGRAGARAVLDSLALRGRVLLRTVARRARPERRRQGQDRRRRARLPARGWVPPAATSRPPSPSSRLARRRRDHARQRRARDEQRRRAPLAARRRARSITSSIRRPASRARTPWRDVTVAAGTASRPTLPRRPPFSSARRALVARPARPPRPVRRRPRRSPSQRELAPGRARAQLAA